MGQQTVSSGSSTGGSSLRAPSSHQAGNMPACPLRGTRRRAVQRPPTNSFRFFDAIRPAT